jgi:hypothetical protein
MTKEDTPLPLLSDERIAKVMAAEFSTQRDHVVACGVARAIRNIYEEGRLSRDAKIKSLEGLVQELVDAAAQTQSDFDGLIPQLGAALSSAKALDFEPKNPQ